MKRSEPVTFSLGGEPEVHLLGTYTRYSSKQKHPIFVATLTRRGWTARVVTVLEYFRIPYRATYVPLVEVLLIEFF